MQRTIEAFKLQSALLTKIVTDGSFNMDQFLDIAPHFTSHGDMTRLHIFEQFRPTSGNDTLIVEDLLLAVRFPLPEIPYAIFQYDGSLHLLCHVGKRFGTQDSIDFYATLAKEWFDDVIP